MTRAQNLTSRRVFIALTLLACGQVWWWAHLIVQEKPALRLMIIAEGLFFVGILISGILFAYKSLKKELELRQSQTDFLSAVTHELKTPLANVRLCLDTLERPNLTVENRQKYLERAQVSIDQLLDEIETILTLSNQDPSLREVRMAPIKSLIDGVLSTLEPGTIKRIEVSVKDANFVAPYHESRLIIRNLIDNAIKYSSASSTQNPDSKITIKGYMNGSVFELQIQDQGSGLSEEDLARAFEPFYRGSASRKSSPSGTGLGLTLVKRLADRAGIRIALASDGLGKGACATVTWSSRERAS